MNPDTNDLAAVCGLNCRICKIYNMSDKEFRYEDFPYKQGNVNVKSCNGCRSQNRCTRCDECKVFDCAWEKGYEQCSECPDYPCAELKLLRQVRESQQ